MNENEERKPVTPLERLVLAQAEREKIKWDSTRREALADLLAKASEDFGAEIASAANFTPKWSDNFEYRNGGQPRITVSTDGLNPVELTYQAEHTVTEYKYTEGYDDDGDPIGKASKVETVIPRTWSLGRTNYSYGNLGSCQASDLNELRTWFLLTIGNYMNWTSVQAFNVEAQGQGYY